MTDIKIEYDKMVQSALLGIVRDVLQDTAENGLPGEHHFYVTFDTNHPGVVIPNHLKEKYPDDMTIVLQNQFWDMLVDKEHFEISLSFNRVKEHLYIPFDALLGFLDPSVDFGLHFQTVDEEELKDINDQSITLEATPKEDDIVEPTSSDDDKVVTLDSFRKK